MSSEDRRYKKEYNLYKLGGSTYATGLPIEVLKYEAEQRGMTVSEFRDNFKAVVSYNNFEGVRIEFERKEGEE